MARRRKHASLPRRAKWALFILLAAMIRWLWKLLGPPATASQPELHHTGQQPEHPRVRFERRDAWFRWLGAMFVAAICVACVQYFVVWHYWRDREQHQQVVKTSPYPLAPGPRSRLPKEPRLEQVDRLAGLQSSDARERELAAQRMLTSYGATPEKGMIRIPIHRAMKLVLADLPVRKQSADRQFSKDNGLLYSGDSNSGRVFREPPR